MEWLLWVSSLRVGTMFCPHPRSLVQHLVHLLDGWVDGWMDGCLFAPEFQAWRNKGEQDPLFPAPGILGQGELESRALELDTFCFKSQLGSPDCRVTLDKSLHTSFSFLIHVMGTETASHRADD